MAWKPENPRDKSIKLSPLGDNPLGLSTEDLIAWRKHREKYFCKMATVKAILEDNKKPFESLYIVLYPCALGNWFDIKLAPEKTQKILKALSSPETMKDGIRYL